MTALRSFWYLPVLLALILGMATVAVTPADAAPRATAYTVTRTFGPFNGEATWQNDLPGQLPDGEALWVACDTNDRIVSHGFSVDRMGGRKILRVEEKGVSFSRYEPDDQWMFYIFFVATGKPGWNNVTMTATCRDTAAPYRS